MTNQCSQGGAKLGQATPVQACLLAMTQTMRVSKGRLEQESRGAALYM